MKPFSHGAKIPEACLINKGIADIKRLGTPNYGLVGLKQYRITQTMGWTIDAGNNVLIGEMTRYSSVATSVFIHAMHDQQAAPGRYNPVRHQELHVQR